MIRIGILGDIGSGKSFVANNFGYPVFNADHEVSKLYKKNKKVFFQLKKNLLILKAPYFLMVLVVTSLQEIQLRFYWGFFSSKNMLPG